jgi:hypothetical protein
MPQPTSSQVWVDQLLTNVSVAYSNAEFIADRLFPTLPVTNQSGILPIINQSAFFRNEAKLRAPGTKSVGTGFTVNNTNTYFCPRFSIRHEIPDEVRDNAASVYDQDRLATNLVTELIMLNREVAFATNLFTTSVWAGGTSGGDNTISTVWSNYSGSSPLTEVEGWRDTMQGSLGRDPNTLVIGRQVWTQLKYHPDVIDLIKYSQAVRGPIAPSSFAAMVEVDNVFVGSSIYTTSIEGTAEASVSYTRVWGKHALLLYVPPGPAMENPAAGYTVVWQRVPTANQYIKRMRNEETEVDIIEANSYYQQKAVVTKAGAFCSSVVA